MTSKFITEFTDVLTPEQCENIITKIKSRDTYDDLSFWLDKHNDQDLISLNEFFRIKTRASVEEYIKQSAGLVSISSLSLQGFAAIRQPIGYSDPLHHDIETIINKDNVRIRAFVALIYLNNDFEGGQLVFPTLNRVVEPKAGKLTIFPASYLFPHMVLNTSKAERYFIRLHYTMKLLEQDQDNYNTLNRAVYV